MKKFHHLYKFCIFSLPSSFALIIFQVLGSSSTKLFEFLIPPIQKRTWVRNNLYSPKNIWNNICFFWVFPLEHFDVVFYSCLLLDMVFVKNLPHFYGQIKQKADNRFHFPTKNNKLIESQIKGLLTFWEVKFFGWFTHIGYKRIQFRMSCAWHECTRIILQTI